MSEPIIEVVEGKLKGKVSKTLSNFLYYSFIGIPYAKPPIGGLRFSVPQSPEPWEGIKDTAKECNICAQYDNVTQTVIGDEDCLYLNVYSPSLPSSSISPLPVMVFFHGGGFIFGNGTDPTMYGPDYLVTKEVILVTVNYRLGVLGFLSLDLKDAPGNMGMRDQVQALKWIQRNIDKFGGNPKNVTIFGISAGGASVEYLMVSPMAKGLFHKAIAQSGSSLLHWAQNDKNKIKVLASKMSAFSGNVITDNETLLNYLKSLSTKDLIELSMRALGSDDFKGGIHFAFVPTIETSGDWEPFLDKSTYEILARGEFNKVPFMTGFCEREGLLTVPLAAAKLEKLEKERIFVKHFPFDLEPVEITDMETELKNVYLDGEKKWKEADAFAIDFFTDVDFLGGIYVAAKLIARHNSPVYLYEFSYDGSLNLMKKTFGIDRQGAVHADDGGYLLKSDKLGDVLSKDDVLVQNVMLTTWTNFAKYGNPTPETDKIVPIKWEPMSQTRTVCFVIDKEVCLKTDIYPERIRIYEDIYDKKYGNKNN